MTDATTTTSAEARLAELGIVLPAIPLPAGNYVHAVRTGTMIHLAGHIPLRPDGTVIFGRLGETLDADAGYEAARVAAAGMLSTLRHELGSLDRVAQIVRVFGVVNATPDFVQHTKVINGASDVLTEVFGERGTHARLAVGVASLPFNICLEVDLIAEVVP